MLTKSDCVMNTLKLNRLWCLLLILGSIDLHGQDVSIFDFGSGWGDGYHPLYFILDGDVGKFIDMIILDENNENVQITMKQSSGENQITYYFDSEPKPEWKLQVLVETTGSTKIVPFNFKDLRLP